MTKALSFIRGNAIALLALFIALGGSSYAAIAIPAGSVGTKQLRNGAVTPVKLASSEIGGVVRAWAEVNASGTIVAASGFTRSAHPNQIPGHTSILLKTARVRGCAASASVVLPPLASISMPGFAIASPVDTAGKPYGVSVDTFNAAGAPTPLSYVVELLCPA
jgi:hypothetical protein